MFSEHLLNSLPMLLAQAGDRSAVVLPGIGTHLLNVLIYSVTGVLILGGCFMLIKRMLPFSVNKEIEQDQNVALAIVMAAVIIGMSMIISAAIL